MPLRVLVVDDSPVMRVHLKKILSSSGLPIHEILEAGDGLQALGQMSNHTVNLVLSDINMPNMNGEELVKKIREDERYKDVAIIMVTTDGSVARVHRLRQLGAQGYICKPFTPEIVVAKISAILEEVVPASLAPNS